MRGRTMGVARHHRSPSWGPLLVLGLAAVSFAPRAEAGEEPLTAKRVAVVVPADASPGERLIAETLRGRIRKRSKVDVQVRSASGRAEGADPDVEIVLRRAAPPATAPVTRPANRVPTLEDGPLPP